MTKRLKYTKDILTHMFNSNQKLKNCGNPQSEEKKEDANI